MKFTETTIEDILHKLPEINKVDFKEDFENKTFDFYIQALGFEQRTVAFSENLSKVKNFRVNETIVLNYKTNLEDNSFFESIVLENSKKYSKQISKIVVDENLLLNLRQRLLVEEKPDNPVKIILDFSTLSSHLILSIIKLLLHLNIELIITYAEGAIYHPTTNEYNTLKTDIIKNPKLEQTYGVDNVIISPEYSGGEKENLDIVICFPSFKAERTEAIITYIDDLILKQENKERLIWIIGNPHMDEPEKSFRKEIQKEIHLIDSQSKTYEVCTLDYKNTLRTLEHIYKDIIYKYHFNISDLGSKMQSFGIALFANIHRNVSVYYSEPIKYNPIHYSEGIKDLWSINIGNTRQFRSTLFQVGTLIQES